MKKTVTTITLTLVMTLGATFANAGIIIGDAADTGKCTATDKSKDGIIIGDITGIIIGDIMGIIIGDSKGGDQTPCVAKEKNGILVGD